MSKKMPLVVAIVWLSSMNPLRADSKLDYNRDIRPILSDKCYKCHGPDERTRQAGLRLDRFEEATARLKSGVRAIVPGDARGSELARRIAATDDADRMPPSESGKALSKGEVELLRRWIEEGARYSKHWSLISPKRAGAPEVESAWPRNEIDRFLLAEMQRQGLSPSAEAERRALIRRLSFDLTGLPPTRAEVEAFASDETAGAYEKLVERLLSSGRHGEHMALDWLDAARYGDTNGYHIDNERFNWRWRDWVIDAYNANMPFDRFTVEQLAGDLLPGATLEQKIATGFNRNHIVNFEGGAIEEEYLNAYVVDRVNTTSTVWLGMTVSCAQCHDHKFDPITQDEYYGLYAFFNTIAEKGLDGAKTNPVPSIAAPLPEQRGRFAELGKRLRELEVRLNGPRPDLDARQAGWEEQAGADVAADWTLLAPFSAVSTGGTTLTPQGDGSIVASGEHPAREDYEIVALTEAREISAVRVEALAIEGVAGGGPGRAEHANFVLSEFEVEIAPLSDPSKVERILFEAAHADHSQAGFNVMRAIDGDLATGWAVADPVRAKPGVDRVAVFVAGRPFGYPGGTAMKIRLRFQSKYPDHALARVRLAASTNATRAPALARSTVGVWEVSGPYWAETAREAYDRAFEPESAIGAGGATSAESQVERRGGKDPRRWTPRTDFADGRAHSLLEVGRETRLAGPPAAFGDAADPRPGDAYSADVARPPSAELPPRSVDNSAVYLRRGVYAPTGRRMTVSVASDDALKMWVNGKLVHANYAARSVVERPDTVSFDLDAGRNSIVLKVVNMTGEFGFAFERLRDDGIDPPLEVEQSLRRAAGARSEEQKTKLREYYRSRHWEEWPRIKREADAARAEYDRLASEIPQTMVMEELAEPRKTYFLTRGQYDQRAHEVEPGVPAVFPPLFVEGNAAERNGASHWRGAEVDTAIAPHVDGSVVHPKASAAGRRPNRLDLARWLVRSDHPLTARVAVNRLWQLIFGVGIVGTPEDFGSQGEWPTHPELLDWLAREYIDSGWDTRHMIRLMVTSAAYRQTSDQKDAAARERDPGNRWHWRGGRRRLSAEALRDNALSIGGILVERIGGPSVKIYQPPGLWEEVSLDPKGKDFSAQVFEADKGEALYRRSLYVFIKRSVPPPTMALFDAPSREFCVVRRSSTNTPLQALALLNDPVYVEAARAFAQRLLREQVGGTDERITAAFEIALSRPPTAAELTIVRDLYARQRAAFDGDEKGALELLSVGALPKDEKLDARELAAWTAVASVILNLDETITRG